MAVTSKTTRATQTVELSEASNNSVSVFSNQKQRFEYWSHRRELLKQELHVAKQEIEDMLSDLMAQLDTLIQPKT